MVAWPDAFRLSTDGYRGCTLSSVDFLAEWVASLKRSAGDTDDKMPADDPLCGIAQNKSQREAEMHWKKSCAWIE